MPRQLVRPGAQIVHLDLVRLYLRQATPQHWFEVMDAAFEFEEAGAVELLVFCLAVRANRRSRRRLPQVHAAWRLRRLQGLQAAGRRSWFDELGQSALAMFRALRLAAYPMLRGHDDRVLTSSLRRRERRSLRASGVVVAELPVLSAQADVAAGDLWQSLVGQDVVLWIDNWYRARYRPDPENPNVSRDVSVMAVLRLSSTTDVPALRTRSRSFGTFPGQSSLLRMVGRIETIDDLTQAALHRLVQKVRMLTAHPIEAKAIRVPLDVPRPSRPRLQWRALALSKNRVGSGAELLKVLESVRRVQQHIGQPLPLLVDEKVHYSVMRLLYAPAYWGLDVAGWLRQVPVIYGCWHPYKHTLTLVYRWFLPIFMHLEMRAAPRIGTSFKMARKVAFMEKMVAALLLASHTVRDEVHRAQGATRSPSVQGSFCAQLRATKNSVRLGLITILCRVSPILK